MPNNRLPEFQVIMDTREQKGFEFFQEEKKPGRCQCLGTVRECLDAGDYSIKGMENLIRIEKKYGFSELIGNMTPKESKERFEREMEKLKDIKYKYLVIESSLSDDLLCLSIPQIFRGPTMNVVLKWVFELQVKYNIVPIFAGPCAKRTIREIFEAVIRAES
jgi:hypothetical protein